MELQAHLRGKDAPANVKLWYGYQCCLPCDGADTINCRAWVDHIVKLTQEKLVMMASDLERAMVLATCAAQQHIWNNCGDTVMIHFFEPVGDSRYNILSAAVYNNHSVESFDPARKEFLDGRCLDIIRETLNCFPEDSAEPMWYFDNSVHGAR